MSLLSLPNELLLQVAKDLNAKTVYSLLRANRYLALLLSPILLKHVFKEDRHCVTALYLAAVNRNERMIRLLLEECGARIMIGGDQKKDFSDSRLPGCQLPMVVKYLLENGVDSVVQDLARGGTALHWAAEFGHEVMFKFLIEKGASTTICSSNGLTVLHWAAHGGNHSIVSLLLNHGVDINAIDTVGVLHIAAGKGHESLVRLFLENGAAIDTQDYHNLQETPLLTAVSGNQQAVVKLLLKNGANINVMDNIRNSVLHRAAALRDDSMTKLLLENEAFPFFQNLMFQMPIDIAREYGYPATVKTLEDSNMFSNTVTFSIEPVSGLELLH